MAEKTFVLDEVPAENLKLFLEDMYVYFQKQADYVHSEMLDDPGDYEWDNKRYIALSDKAGIAHSLHMELFGQMPEDIYLRLND